jgi:hypothetical protein
MIAKGIDAEAEVTIASGFKAVDESGLSEGYYANLRTNESDAISSEVGIDFEDIIKRCRLLRSLPHSVAILHVIAMKEAVSDLFDAVKPDLVISATIDQFLMDVIYFESLKRGIPFVGLVISFVNGYYRVSARGEYNHLRNVPDNEVQSVIQKLEQNSYKPKFVTQSGGNFKVAAIDRWFKNALRIPYFFMKRLLTGEKYNYHYWASQLTALNNFNLYPTIQFGSKSWKQVIDSSKKPIVYIPLQYFPEATIDYWCEDLDVIDYEDKLIDYVQKLSSDFQILIKEHPNVIGIRNSSLYRELSKIEGVVICPTYEDSNYIVDLCDAVLVWTGSVGFEAALRSKPVIAVCNPYYAIGGQFLRLYNNTSSEEILSFIKDRSRSISHGEKSALVSHVLSGLLPGKYINDASWDSSNENDVQDAKQIGTHIRKYICHM